MPEWFSADVRHCLNRNLQDGRICLLSSSRVYSYAQDRTYTAEEYAFGQGWGEDVVLNTLHKPVPEIKRAKAFMKALAMAHKKGEDPDTVTLPAGKAKKANSGAKARATRQKPGDMLGIDVESGGRGPIPWFNKTVACMGNAVDLAEFSAVAVSMVLSMPESSDTWEFPPPNAREIPFLQPARSCVFRPDMEKLEDDYGRWSAGNLSLREDSD